MPLSDLRFPQQSMSDTGRGPMLVLFGTEFDYSISAIHEFHRKKGPVHEKTCLRIFCVCARVGRWTRFGKRTNDTSAIPAFGSRSRRNSAKCRKASRPISSQPAGCVE